MVCKMKIKADHLKEYMTCKDVRRLVKTKTMRTATGREMKLMAEHAMGCKECRAL